MSRAESRMPLGLSRCPGLALCLLSTVALSPVHHGSCSPHGPCLFNSEVSYQVYSQLLSGGDFLVTLLPTLVAISLYSPHLTTDLPFGHERSFYGSKVLVILLSPSRSHFALYLEVIERHVTAQFEPFRAHRGR
jgi:hypothetical protein